MVGYIEDISPEQCEYSYYKQNDKTERYWYCSLDNHDCVGCKKWNIAIQELENATSTSET